MYPTRSATQHSVCDRRKTVSSARKIFTTACTSTVALGCTSWFEDRHARPEMLETSKADVCMLRSQGPVSQAGAICSYACCRGSSLFRVNPCVYAHIMPTYVRADDGADSKADPSCSCSSNSIGIAVFPHRVACFRHGIDFSCHSLSRQAFRKRHTMPAQEATQDVTCTNEFTAIEDPIDPNLVSSGGIVPLLPEQARANRQAREFSK